VVYHGGQANIKVFLNPNENEDYEKTKHANYHNDNRVGIYFSKYEFVGKSYARRYGKDKQIYEVFLNIRNIKNVSFAENFKNKLIKTFTFGLIDKPNVQNVRKTDLVTYYDGFDGLSHENGEEFVVFNSNQIKSATDNSGMFSNDSLSILEKKRDNKVNINKDGTIGFLFPDTLYSTQIKEEGNPTLEEFATQKIDGKEYTFSTLSQAILFRAYNETIKALKELEKSPE
jgi:hypothetical protein